MSKLPRPLEQALRQTMSIVMPFTVRTLSRLGLQRQVLQFMGRMMADPRFKRDAFAGYQPTRHDVIVTTYAKSGTYWMLQIVHQIANLGEGEYEHIHHVVPWPDAPLASIIPLDDPTPQQKAPTGMRAIKTHLESQYVPYHPDAKYIVVVRDPKEVFVSSYHFSQRTFNLPKMIPVAEWLDWFTKPERFTYGSWPEHLAGYWPWRERPNVLFLTYGEMKANPRHAVERVAALMGVALNEEQLGQVLTKSSFAYMRKIDHKFNIVVPFIKRDPAGGVMIRRGESGGSSELITPEQQSRIDKFCQEELRRLGCDFPYPDTFTLAQAQPKTSHAPA